MSDERGEQPMSLEKLERIYHAENLHLISCHIQ